MYWCKELSDGSFNLIVFCSEHNMNRNIQILDIEYGGLDVADQGHF